MRVPVTGKWDPRRLGDLPLIWRFMAIPLMGVLIMASLGWVILDLRKESIGQLVEMRTDFQERSHAIGQLGGRLAQTYSNIYQLLIDARHVGSEAELYRLSRPHLNALHDIEGALQREFSVFEADPALAAELGRLIKTLAQTRVASTNALLVSTVEFELASSQAAEVTRLFHEVNRRLLLVHALLHENLDDRTKSLVDEISQRTSFLGVLFFAELAVAIAIAMLIITSVLRAMNRSVLSVSRITRAGAGKSGSPDTGNEIILLNTAIEDARQSHEKLQAAGASLSKSNEELQKREQALSETNARLADNIGELNRVIQERDKAETALSRAQRMEAIGNLTGGVAHDFNNLLAIILGNLENLREEKTEAGREKRIEAAIGATLRGAELTKSMLAFARRARLEPKVLDLNDIVLRTKNWAGRTLQATIDVETSLLAGLWQVETDESSTESALLNLILNARDAMPDGGRLTIETANVRIDEEYVEARTEEIEPGRYAMLAVSDTGTGIAKEVQKRIFEPYFTTKAPGEGSGLGLSMIEGFTRQSGGAVRVYSEPGVGSTFKLFFKACTGGPDKPELPKYQADAITRGSVSVFVVEDEPGVLGVLVNTLEKAGYSVRSAISGDEALAKFKDGPAADILLTDIVMPGELQGTSLAKELRKLWPDLPVIFLSGYASEATVHGNGLRAEDIRLMKPVRTADLLNAMEKVRLNVTGGA